MNDAYEVRAEREDGWWIVTVPALDAVTQAKRVDQIEHMARDLIAAWLDVKYDDVAVDVNIVLPEPWQAQVDNIREHRARAEEEAAVALREARRAAQRLHEQVGLPFRDVGAVLGVSFQRAKQLADEAHESAEVTVRVSVADVRTWAREQGYDVAERGRVPASVVDAYRAARRTRSGRRARVRDQASSR